ncbi:N-acetyltransferase GCN5 [Clostridium pasteurianum DSM 525 = ATCC 6013]|uniref:GCN5-related N-acetyltransferase n=1 Tax=Clostridium pasteurianum DSM 525 = ATCC 6013 TaxID=1262449 RepID=A0A0H3J2N4_CLOPA|nr:GNAT family N-acetyltransferase [Clostridium pasteurianum]AJA47077.1 N-acetyltransferase GCN5 [Clostridium pasteurianum DSM 525 = ATCC 6013]AJA51065.1 N-acetyltransferase GCN5 [Clostridium pasteurianum DSM 525 = ATCC 6013]ELP59536.1 N-acetyltransferase GCN5 [Clostridium pasteurianum DSM 525 = ATCC 6013]KRU12927.1 GCN5-related N-acetyltransferase [Clostridium pasteurianum DSM 525 = ATCC 6013]UZW15238.1 GNAT family N-acetyltransferase [Clostridium pasteurianum]
MNNIVTDRLIIIKFNEADWKDIYEYLSNETVVKYEPYNVYTESEARKEAINRAKSEFFYAVCLKEVDKLIGNLYLAKGDFSTWEIGYVFNLNYWGKGYATESVKALINKAFSQLDARRIVAMCNPLNEHSWKLLERIGMRREGTLLKNIYFKKDINGEPLWADTYEYGILKSEWITND